MLRKLHWKSWLGVVLMCVFVMGQGCPQNVPGVGDPVGDAPGTMGGTVDVANLTIPAGQSTHVVSDLVINASGDVRIDGQMVADPPSHPGDKGISITIHANGKIDIGGTVQAGDGTAGEGSAAAGGSGGVLSLSAGGNLTLNTDAMLVSGSGGGGAELGLGGAGGDAGDLFLEAGGTLTIRSSLTIGNGGDGGPPTLDSLTGSDTFTGDGGNSGYLIINANTVDWPGYDPLTNIVDLNQVDIQGGRGGDGASLIINVVQDKAAATSVTHGKSKTITTPWTFSCPSVSIGCAFNGPKGGDGYIAGGDGGSVTINASAVRRAGVGTSTVLVNGGPGGDIICKTPHSGVMVIPMDEVRFRSIAGKGGDATITGLSGGPGMPGQEVWANGGDGGNALCGEFTKGGAGGKAVAHGGDGGKGNDGDCSLGGGAGQGDNGGGGGTAHALGGSGGSGPFGGSGGDAEAYGGFGGDGGMPGGAPGLGGGADAGGGVAGASIRLDIPSHVPPSKHGFAITVPGGKGSNPPSCP